MEMGARTLWWLCWLCGALSLLATAEWEEGVSAARVLTNAAQIRALSPEEAALGLPVRLRGVVTALNPGRSVFLQDATGGTFLTHISSALHSLRPGDDIAVEGITWPGLYVPGVVQAAATVLGTAELPPPIRVSYDDLLAGRFHYERVDVEGIVRSVDWHQPRDCLLLVLAMGTRKLDVEIVVPGVSNLPPLVDARVRVVGLAAGYINSRRQLYKPELLVSRLEDLRVESPPPEHPWAKQLCPVPSLLRFQAGGELGHRVRVCGVVTHQQPGEALYLRDQDTGLLVHTRQPDLVRPGDVVEALGFPAMGRFTAFLEDAQFRVIGRTNNPEPRVSTARALARGSNDTDLVTLQAKLFKAVHTEAETVLVLGDGDTVFRAFLAAPVARLRPGSLLRLTGVCRVGSPNLAGERFRAQPFEVELLLRSPADLTVLQAPSGWSSRRLMVLVGVLLAAAVVAGCWVVLLRRRVAHQTAVILEKIQREAVLEERQRMARELHDTLAQSFSGLGFQLDALAARLPQEATEARAQLDVARVMVQHGRENLRRSLMNLRAPELERGSLTEVLPELARQITTGTGITLDCDIAALPTTLPEMVQANLLRIGQECLVNAIQHARPRRIGLRLAAEDGQVQLRVTDDGIGFDPRRAEDGEGRHFGWRGIRERAAQIGAQVTLETRPGRGTAVTVRVPLARRAQPTGIRS